MDKLITRSITPEVEIDLHFFDKLWLTEVDPGDFEDALLNLILNARDAMAGRGRLMIETCNSTLDASYCSKNNGISPGDYVQLIVSDTGTGISPEQQERIFEPFFTTKDDSKGTGLGLAMVFGFTQRSEGHIKVYSELDIGTTFRLYLPRYKGQEQVINITEQKNQILSRGTETILVVDDEEGLLEIAEESLQALGYRVITANNANQALKRLSEDDSISLLFSDVVMPGGISGYELAELAVEQQPELKVLLTSGYTKKVVAHNGQAKFNSHLLCKPYTQFELAHQIRSVLGASKITASILNETDDSLVEDSSTLVEWNDDLSVNIKLIDDDHKILIDLLNRCEQLEGNDSVQENMITIMVDLMAYAKYHFKREEAVMKACAYPGLKNHCQVHQFLIKQIEERQHHIQQGNLTLLELQMFLKSWLLDHILGMDMAFSSYCEGKDEIIARILEPSKGDDLFTGSKL